MLSRLERPPPAVIVLADHQDLKKVTAYLLPVLSVQAIHLRIAALSAIEQDLWQSRIDEHLQACGCVQALIGTTCLLGMFGAYRWLDRSQSWDGWWTFLVAFGLAAAGAGLGKISGLIGARLRLRRTLLDLEKALTRGFAVSPK